MSEAAIEYEPADECWTPGCHNKHDGCYAVTNHGETTITYAGPEELACTIDITYVMLCKDHGEGPVEEAISGNGGPGYAGMIMDAGR